MSAPSWAQATPADANELRASRLLVRGMTMLHSGDATSARATFEMALHLSPNNPSILAALADAYSAADDLGEALHYGGRALTAAPQDAENARRLSDNYAKDGNVDAGIDALRRHLRASSTLSGHLILIAYLGKNNRTRDAIAASHHALTEFGPEVSLIDAVLDLRPDANDLPARNRVLSELLTAVGDPEVVMSSLDDARLDHDSAREIQASVASHYPVLSSFARGDRQMVIPGDDRVIDDDDAVSWYHRAVSNPRDVEAWAGASVRLLHAGKAGLALEAARDGSALFPGREDLAALRIRAAVALGDDDEILAAARAALRNESSVELAYAAAALIDDDGTDLPHEARDFVSDVVLQDEYARVIGALALSRNNLAPRRLAPLLDRLDERARSSAELSGLRGLIEIERGNHVLAQEWLERAVTLGAAVPVALEALAGMHEAGGDHDSAHRLKKLALDRRSTEL